MKGTMRIEPHSVIGRGGDVLSAELEEEIVMLSINTGDYLCLDPIGSCIWRMLDVPVSFSELCCRLTEEFHVELEQCQQEVGAFLEDLANEGVIHVVAAPGL